MTIGPSRFERQLASVLSGRPEVVAALTEAHDAAWASVAPHVLGICELRTAMLLGHTPTLEAADPALVIALPRWYEYERFTALDRAALAFAEQFVIDVASMDDALVAPLLEQLGADGLLEFTNALLVIEQRQRLALVWDRLMPEEAV